MVVADFLINRLVVAVRVFLERANLVFELTAELVRQVRGQVNLGSHDPAQGLPYPGNFVDLDDVRSVIVRTCRYLPTTAPLDVVAQPYVLATDAASQPPGVCWVRL